MLYFSFAGLGGSEILVVGVAVLLLFGAKKVPEVFRSLGQGISEFKRASRDVFRELEDDRPALQGRTQASQEGAAGPTSPDTAQDSSGSGGSEREQ